MISPAVPNSCANDSLTFTSVYLESCLCTVTKNPHQKSTKAKHSLQLQKLNSCFEWGFNYLFPGKAKHNKLSKQTNKKPPTTSSTISHQVIYGFLYPKEDHPTAGIERVLLAGVIVKYFPIKLTKCFQKEELILFATIDCIPTSSILLSILQLGK